jgi:hypothetical protein
VYGQEHSEKRIDALVIVLFLLKKSSLGRHYVEVRSLQIYFRDASFFKIDLSLQCYSIETKSIGRPKASNKDLLHQLFVIMEMALELLNLPKSLISKNLHPFLKAPNKPYY